MGGGGGDWRIGVTRGFNETKNVRNFSEECGRRAVEFFLIFTEMDSKWFPRSMYSGFKVISKIYYFSYFFTFTAQKMAVAIGQQRSIFKIKKPVEVLGYT
jgi:hypothetical protein